jgi:NB-ARC domain
MDLVRAIDYSNRLLLRSRQRSLSPIEQTVLKAIWLDLAYQDASKDSNYEVATIKNAASKLLQDLSQATEERVTKKTCKSLLLCLMDGGEGRVDWGNAPIDLQPFCGREMELKTLQHWTVDEGCKLIGILGLGGIGKTSLAAKLGDRVSGEFNVVIWRSLREAPPLHSLLVELVQFLSQFTEVELPTLSDRSIARLLHYLQKQRCLIILDNAEAIMESGDYAGKYRPSYQAYGQLFETIGTARHQSCLIFTSREPAPELIELAGHALPVRSLQLQGLDQSAKTLLEEIGLPKSADLDRLVDRCQGNPLYLRIVAKTILQTFNGEVAKFLNTDQYTYGKITAVLQAQLDRLTPAEKIIIYQLAIKREPQTLSELEHHLAPLGLKAKLGPSIDSLKLRSLIEVTQAESYTLQNVVMEFMTDATIQELSSELLDKRDAFFLTTSASTQPALPPTFALSNTV